MRSYNIDWPLFCTTLPVWAKLSHKTRQKLFNLKPNAYESIKVFDQGDVATLLKEQLLREDAQGKRVAIGFNDRARVFSKTFRALGRGPLPLESDQSNLRDYVINLLTAEETNAIDRSSPSRMYESRRDFTEPMSVQWVRQFLDLPDAAAAHKWEKQRLPAEPSGGTRTQQFEDGSPYFHDPAMWQATRSLVEASLTWTRPLPLDKLPKQMPKLDEALLWKAVTAAVRYLWLFPRLDEHGKSVVIGPWPQITFLLHRPAATAPKPMRPQQRFHGCVRVDDMQTILINAAAEPLRLLASGDGIYQKDLDTLTQAITPAPDWLAMKFDAQENLKSGMPSMDPINRLEDAMRECLSQKLLETRRGEGKRRCYHVTDAARAWLAQTQVQRLQVMIDPWRAAAVPKPAARKPDKTGPKAGQPRRPIRIFELGGFFAMDEPQREPNPWVSSGKLEWLLDSTSSNAIDWPGAVAGLFKEQDPDDFLPLGGLLQYHSRVGNPLLGHHGPRPKLRRNAYDYEGSSDLWCEHVWQAELATLLCDQLLVLGALEIAMTDGVYGVRLHPIGRYMLGLDDKLTLPAAPQGQVIIQPNFEVVFLGPSPTAEASIGRLAQRVGQGVGTLFRLTREAALAAAAAGVTAEQALDELRNATSKALPTNVEHEVRGWFATTRRATLRHAVIIDTPDPDTASRIQAAAGKDARRLAPQLVEITTTGSHATLIRKLKTQGVFIET